MCFFSNTDINSELLLKIWCAVYSYKRSIEFTKRNCELLEEENERISNGIIALEEKWTQSEIENAELRVELCNLRYDVTVLEKYFNSLH